MRRMFLIMIVLAFAMPAMAAVTITAVNEGGGVVRIDYSTDANVSAFALEVSFDNGATIEDVNDFHEGESVTGDKGYGIFLDRINGIKINPQGEITDAGKPIADEDAPDACDTGLGENKVILEMGALYAEGNQPDLSGTLCKIYYKLCRYWWNDLTPPTTTMTIAGNATRGNVVLEDATAATTNLPITLPGLTNTEFCTCIDKDHKTPDFQLFGGSQVNGRYKDFNDFNSVGRPGCWCADNDPNANPRQCWGDADKFAEGKKKYWAAVYDLTVLLTAWQKPYSHATLPFIAGKTTTVGANVVPQICADFDHFAEGKKKYRVSVFDLNILLSNWQIVDTRTPPVSGLPDPTCP